MNSKTFSVILGALLSAQAGAECVPYETAMQTAAPQTVNDNMMASFQLTRDALRRQAYLDCIKPEMDNEQPDIELDKIEVEFTIEEQRYPEARNAVASK